MHGNVYEWTADAYGSHASGAQTDPFNDGGNFGLGPELFGVVHGTLRARTCVQPRAAAATPAAAGQHRRLPSRPPKVLHVVELNSTVKLEMIWVDGTFGHGQSEE